MKLSDNSRFGWPILWEKTGDYPTGSFELKIANTDLSADPETGEWLLRYELVLSSPTFDDLLKRKLANLGLIVESSRTLFYEIKQVSEVKGEIRLPAACLRGEVSIRGICWSATDISALPVQDLHPEYHSGPQQVPKHNLLALTSEVSLQAESKDTPSLSAILKLSESEELPDGEFGVNLAQNDIVITCNKRTKELVEGFRYERAGRILLLNSVYLPVIMSVLAEMKENSGDHDQKKWHSVIEAELKNRGVSRTEDYFKAAQALFRLPFRSMEAVAVTEKK